MTQPRRLKKPGGQSDSCTSLGLLPMGHVSERSPLGNPARAVIAFKPMYLRPELTALKDRARGI